MFLLNRRTKAGQHLHFDRKHLHAAVECIVVLLRQNRGRHQHGNLIAILHRFERRSQRDFGFAVANIAADQAIHRARFFHIALDIFQRPQLVVGFGKRKTILKFALPVGIRAVGVTGYGLASGV